MTVAEVAREALPALSAGLVGGLVAGVGPGGMRSKLRAVSGLVVLVSALLATRGNVYGTLGARIATALHYGLVEPRRCRDVGRGQRLWRARGVMGPSGRRLDSDDERMKTRPRV